MPSTKDLNHYAFNKTSAPNHRSTWKMPFTSTITMKEGDIVPIYWENVQPGDTFQIGLNYVIRMLTPVVPTMDNCYVDFYAFFCTNRNLTKNYQLCNQNGSYGGDWETLFGENKTSYWAQDVPTYLNKYSYPADTTTSEWQYYCLPQSVCDYLGLPIGKSSNFTDTNEICGLTTDKLPIVAYNLCVNGLPFAALEEIYNYWFRDENLEAPTEAQQLGTICEIDKNGNWQGFTLNHKYGTTDGWHHEGKVQKYPFIASRFHDFMTEILPEPYKGETIEIALGDTAPVVATGEITTGDSINIIINGTTTPAENSFYYLGTQGGTNQKAYAYEEGKTPITPQVLYSDITGNKIEATGTADLSSATAITIGDLRAAFALQHLEEAFARGGTRYDEILMSIFGTAPTKYELGKPEYLGGSRQPINITQVVNLAQSGTSDLGELGAMSHSGGQDSTLVSKSFKEHGILMILAVIRTENKYFQGIPRKWSKYELTDFYLPQLQGIGEQEVRIQELYAYMGTNLEDILGYMPRYEEYRYNLDTLRGYANPCSGDETLKAYSYQVPYESQPYLNEEYIKEGFNKVANTLYDQTTLSQFLCNFYLDIKTTREMPLYTIPGLVRM